jgi:hypothetical protein
MHKLILLLLLCLVIDADVQAQEIYSDTIEAVPASKIRRQRVYNPDSTHNAREVMFRSAMVPGWGQLSNKQWWKLPLIYGGFVGTGLVFEFNNRYYREFLHEAQLREVGEPGNPAYVGASNEAIIQVKDYYRRNRDLSILAFIGVWGIQMIDAYVQAKFIHSYTIDDNLSFKVSPGLIGQPVMAGNLGFSYIPSLKLAFTLK